MTVEETNEFFDLANLLAAINPGQPLSSIDWTSPKEMRWLALMQKHAREREKLARARTQALIRSKRSKRELTFFNVS